MLTATEALPPHVTKDRRRAPREELQGWGLVAIPAGDRPGELIPVDFINYGEAGIGAICKRELPIGKQFEILGGPDPIAAAYGKIARCVPTQDGMWFVGLNRADTQAKRLAA